MEENCKEKEWEIQDLNTKFKKLLKELKVSCHKSYHRIVYWYSYDKYYFRSYRPGIQKSKKCSATF